MSNARARRILVADDSDTITVLLATTLKAAGYRVVTAGDGLEAYEIGTEHRIDLAVLDHLMPGLLGMEVLEKWRAEGLDFPVVVLSGVDDENTVVDYLRMGLSTSCGSRSAPLSCLLASHWPSGPARPV